MTSMLLRQFRQGRKMVPSLEYTKYMGHKSEKVLNSIVPDVFGNLKSSSQTFMEAIISGDEEFIQATATPALQKVLAVQFSKLKKDNISMRMLQRKPEQEQALNPQKKKLQQDLKITDLFQREMRFLISPYVIFGQTMQERLKLQNPWQNLYRITSFNRFIHLNTAQGISWKNISQNHIYGFNCFIIMMKKQIEVTQGNVIEKYPCSQMVVSFETNAQNQEFYVSDFNAMVRSP